MKMSVVVEGGKIVAAQTADADERGRGAGLEAGPGQSIEEVDVPDEIIDVSEPAKFERGIGQYLKKGK